MIWEDLRVERQAFYGSLALHLILALLLLLGANPFRSASERDQGIRPIQAHLVAETIGPNPEKGPSPMPEVPVDQGAGQGRPESSPPALSQAAEQPAQAEPLPEAIGPAQEESGGRLQAEAERLAAEEQARLEAEERARRQAETERHRAEQQAREERVRRQAEREARERAEAERRRQAEERARLQDRAERQRLQEEAERLAAEEQARLEAELAQARQRQLAEESKRLAEIEERRLAEEQRRLAGQVQPPYPQSQAEPQTPRQTGGAPFAQDLSEAQRYIPIIRERVRQFWERPVASGAGLSAVVRVRLLPGGEVIPGSVQIVKSSGQTAFDQSVIAAVYRASPLPVPAGAAFAPFREFDLTFRP